MKARTPPLATGTGTGTGQTAIVLVLCLLILAVSATLAHRLATRSRRCGERLLARSRLRILASAVEARALHRLKRRFPPGPPRLEPLETGHLEDGSFLLVIEGRPTSPMDPAPVRDVFLRVALPDAGRLDRALRVRYRHPTVHDPRVLLVETRVDLEAHPGTAPGRARARARLDDLERSRRDNAVTTSILAREVLAVSRRDNVPPAEAILAHLDSIAVSDRALAIQDILTLLEETEALQSPWSQAPDPEAADEVFANADVLGASVAAGRDRTAIRSRALRGRARCALDRVGELADAPSDSPEAGERRKRIGLARSYYNQILNLDPPGDLGARALVELIRLGPGDVDRSDSIESVKNRLVESYTGHHPTGPGFFVEGPGETGGLLHHLQTTRSEVTLSRGSPTSGGASPGSSPGSPPLWALGESSATPLLPGVDGTLPRPGKVGFSADGRRIAFFLLDPTGKPTVFTMDRDGLDPQVVGSGKRTWMPPWLEDGLPVPTLPDRATLEGSELTAAVDRGLEALRDALIEALASDPDRRARLERGGPSTDSDATVTPSPTDGRGLRAGLSAWNRCRRLLAADGAFDPRKRRILGLTRRGLLALAGAYHWNP